MTRLPAAKRREQLLDCAAEVFSEFGYARATTSQLARAAGVTEPIIYRHFKSKRDLFVALIRRTGDDTIVQWEEDLADAKNHAERLRMLLADNPMVDPRGAPAYRVIIQAMTEVEDEMIHAAVAEHMGRLHAFLTEEVSKGQHEGIVVTRVSADVIGWMLIDIALGYGVSAALRIPGHDRDGMGSAIQSIIARMMFRKEALQMLPDVAKPPDSSSNG